LLVVAVAAFAAPLLARLVPRRLVPAVVVEVLAGLVVGPQVFGVVRAAGVGGRRRGRRSGNGCGTMPIQRLADRRERGCARPR
jgi:hypothetical protein